MINDVVKVWGYIFLFATFPVWGIPYGMYKIVSNENIRRIVNES